jgi:hypothetical protein
MSRRQTRGAATLEMTLVGIPIIFTLVSIFEISRGMWMYHTAAHAVREGVRYAIVHGINCDPASGLGNSCLVTAAQVCQVIRDAAVGLDPRFTRVRFTAPTPGGSLIDWIPLDDGSANDCQSRTNTWPPNTGGNNSTGLAIQIDIITPFDSALAMFWPGGGQVTFGTVNLGATSIDSIQF